MTGQWYYSNGGVVHGPFSGDQIKEQAAKKMLGEDDWLWQGGRERKDAVPAQAVLDFSNLPTVASPPLDWLEDVARQESKGPLPAPLPSKEAPAWLEDLRLWFGLEYYAGAKTSQGASATTVQPGGIPDWLESWISPQKPRVSKTAGIVSPAPLPEKAPSAKPEHPEEKKPASEHEDLAAKTMEEAGFDLATGQILDADRFRKWQKASHSPQCSVANESLFETFRKARTAIENWVDEDSHRPLILAGDLGAIKRDVRLLAVFQQFQGFGSEMQAKLMQHLEFMVENRGKYYAACSARGLA